MAANQMPTGSPMKGLFVGPAGVRAGWSGVLFLLILCALLLAFYIALSFAAPLLVATLSGLGQAPPQARLMTASEGLQAIAVVLATWAMAAIEKKSFLDYGLRDRQALPRFGAGLVCGFAALSTLVAMLMATGISLDGVAERGSTALRDAAIWGIVFLLVGVFEELFARGYLQATLARGLGFWPAAILLSILFAALHRPNRGEDVVGVISAGMVGLLFCFSLWWSGSLWWAIGFHASWDWGQSYFYGTADSGTLIQGHYLASHPSGATWLSGGSVGPEGSVLVFVILALLIPVIAVTLRRDPSRATEKAR